MLLAWARLLFAFLCQRVEIVAGIVQQTCADQFVDGIENLQAFFGLIATGLKEDMQVQTILLHFSK